MKDLGESITTASCGAPASRDARARETISIRSIRRSPDATGTMAYSSSKLSRSPRSATKLSMSYIDHNTCRRIS